MQGKNKVNQTHFEVGKKVRQTIKELGGTMPEDLPVAEKGVVQLKKEMNQKSIEKADVGTKNNKL
jgi:DNA-damage-inducible protein D